MGDREATLRAALLAIGNAGAEVTRVSSLYETEPMDVRDQAWFLNLVAECRTELFPVQLLHRLQKVELELGRKRVMAKGPRCIDIDIVLFGRTTMSTLELEIPHPRYRDRRFVLEPLAELSPDLRDPVTNRMVREMLQDVGGQRVKRIEAT